MLANKRLDFVYKYWSRSELGRNMLKSDYVSDSDLFFLIPNNAKKANGLPVTRCPGKKKADNKKRRRRHIMTFKLSELFEEVLAGILPEGFNENYFSEFVDFKNIEIGDPAQ